jgi:hypothetical protein
MRRGGRSSELVGAHSFIGLRRFQSAFNPFNTDLGAGAAVLCRDGPTTELTAAPNVKERVMDAAPALGPLWELLVALLSLGLPGLPPGERDPQLWHIVPADAVLALEWSARGTAVAGEPGIAGLLADPEIQQALQAVHRQAAPAAPPSAIYDISAVHVADMLLQRPGVLYLAIAPPGSGRPLLQRLRIVLLLHAGSDSADVLQKLQPLLPAWMLRDTRANPSLSALVTGLVQFRREGAYLVWGFNAGAADETVQRIINPVGGLSAVPEFADRLKSTNVERPCSVLWLNPGGLLPAVREAIPAGWQARLPAGLGSLGGVVAVTGTEQGRVVTRCSVPRTPRAVAALGREVFEEIPADAQVVVCGTFRSDELESWLNSGSFSVTAEARSALRQLREALLAETQFDIGPEVLAPFGNTWSLYSAPSTGGPLGIGPVFSCKLAQPWMLEEYLPKVMERWRQHLAQGGEAGWSLQQETLLGRTIYTLHAPASARLGIRLSWCLTDRHLLVAPQPQLLRSHLRFLGSAQPRFTSRLSTDVSFPDGCVVWGFIDSPALTRSTWPLLPFVVGRRDAARSAQIPSTGAVLPHVGMTTFSLQAREQSWLAECRNPLSLAVPLLAGIVLADAVLHPDPAEQPAAGISTGVDLGAPAGNASPPSAADAADDAPEESPAVRMARRLAPLLIRAFTPEDVQSLIPAEVFRRLEEGPTPEQRRQRLERRDRRGAKPSSQPDRSGQP